MRSIYFLIILTSIPIIIHSQSDGCYDFNFEDKSLCPQCGEGEVEHDAYRGMGSTYISECKNGVLHGKWVIQSDDIYGNIITNQIGLFINGKRAGKWITSYYPSYGDELKVSEYGRTELLYKNGILEGPCKIYDRGHLLFEGEFKNGHRFGDWKVFGPDLSNEGNYEITKTPVEEIGIAQHEIINDSISKETIYYFDGSDKNKRILISMANYKGNLLHGTYTQFYESGTIAKVKIYKNGKLNGKSYSLEPNGDTINIINYKNDLEYGLKRTFDKNGKLIKQTNLIENPNKKFQKIKHGQFLESDLSEINFDMNKKSGLYWRKTTKNDTLFLDTAYYKDDLLNGKWSTYYFDNNSSSFFKQTEKNYKNNDLHGELKLYDNNQLRKTEAYIENQQKGDICVYNSKGQKIYCAYSTNKIRNGEYRKYEEGNIIEKGNYINNMKEGYWFEYENNAVITITKYKNDITVEYYNKKGKVKKMMKKLLE